jgi:hypothetical protein
VAKLVAVSVVLGCSKPTHEMRTQSASAEEFLKWSMDKYKGMQSFRSDAAVTLGADASGKDSETRRIYFVRPNRFKVEVFTALGFKMKAVSNGEQLVEYANKAGSRAIVGRCGAGIYDSVGMVLQNPMYGGSPLYQFFGGSGRIALLAEVRHHPVTFGDEQPVGGERARRVKFYAANTFGNVEALIGERTGEVYRISFDNAPTTEAIAGLGSIDSLRRRADQALALTKPGPERDKIKTEFAHLPSKVPSAKEFTTTEVYTKTSTNLSIAPLEFDVELPKGIVIIPRRVGGFPTLSNFKGNR